MSIEIAQAVEIIKKKRRNGPVAIVFCDADYDKLLGNWLQHVRVCGFENVVVCALDRSVAAQMSEAGITCCSLTSDGSLENLWVQRTRLFSTLCQENIDFIHSDVDAVWLRNPVEQIFRLNADLIFSQGTIWPPDVAAEWGFVLCCGFFAVRGAGIAAAFFERVASVAEKQGDDQIAVNRVLRDSRLMWQVPENGFRRVLNGRQFFTYDEPLFGSNADLKAVLLPFAEFPRLAEAQAHAFVAHPISPKNVGEKITVLRRLGLWL